LALTAFADEHVPRPPGDRVNFVVLIKLSRQYTDFTFAKQPLWLHVLDYRYNQDASAISDRLDQPNLLDSLISQGQWLYYTI